MIPNIKDLVSGEQMVSFSHYTSGELWYMHENTGFQFPVPISDTGDGVFQRLDRALFFMRWMRKHIAFLQEAKSEGTVVDVS